MNWINREISTGLQCLVMLSLDRSPALDVISKGTLPTWVGAITQGRRFDEERDVPRFRAAFRTLAMTCTQWPTPRQFLDALPALKEQTVALRLSNESSRERVEKHLAEFAQRLNIKSGGSHVG